jgi:hypothetical protein
VAQDAEHRLKISANTGFQSEDFRWSIAGNVDGTNPNILSELKWKDLAGPTAGLSADWNFWNDFHLRSSFSYLFIASGTVTDMDFHGDNRTDTVYHEGFNANKGSTFSWRTTLEYAWKIGEISVIPSAGFSLHHQSLHILDRTGATPALNSTYSSRFLGATAGLRAEFPLSEHISLGAGIIYDRYHFRGQGNWNLIPNYRHPLSFQDDANGNNLEGNIKCSYHLDKWTFFLAGNFLHGKTGKGTDMLYLANGQNAPTQFNEAVRNVMGVSVGASVSLF